MNYSSTKAFAAAGEENALADLTVVGGAGHVGIPLVLAFAEVGIGYEFLKHGNVVH